METPKPEMNLEIGAAMLLQLDQLNSKLRCNFVGMHSGEALIIRLPLHESATVPIHDGQGATLTFLSRGSVYGFRSEVLGKYMKGPLRFVFLAYPIRLEVHNLRREERISCHLPLKVELGDRVLEGIGVDLSRGGVHCVFALDPEQEPVGNLEAGMDAVLYTRLLGTEGQRRLECTVRNINLDSQRLELGLELGDNDPEALNHINTYVEQMLQCIQELRL